MPQSDYKVYEQIAAQGRLPHPSQDPVFDTANGQRKAVTASAQLITPPEDCRFIRVSADKAVYVNTAEGPAGDNAASVYLAANLPDVLPVVPGVAVMVASADGTDAVVRAMPLKARD